MIYTHTQLCLIHPLTLLSLRPSYTPTHTLPTYRVGAVQPQGPADQEQEPPGPVRGDAPDAAQVYT